MTPASAAPVPPALYAIIAAAVHVTVGASLRIVAVIPLADQDWAREGRRDIFSSHRLR